MRKSSRRNVVSIAAQRARREKFTRIYAGAVRGAVTVAAPAPVTHDTTVTETPEGHVAVCSCGAFQSKATARAATAKGAATRHRNQAAASTMAHAA